MNTAELLSQFGNVVVLSGLSATLAIWIFSRVSWKAGALWLGAVVGVAGFVGVLKAVFSGCLIAPWGIHSPSGHASFSTLAYGGLVVVLTAGAGQAIKRMLWGILAAIWVYAIGLSRLWLGAHTFPEVLAGWAIGGLGLLIFSIFYRAPRSPSMRFDLPALGLVLVMGLNPWMHFTPEPGIQGFGQWLALHTPMCKVVGSSAPY